MNDDLIFSTYAVFEKHINCIGNFDMTSCMKEGSYDIVMTSDMCPSDIKGAELTNNWFEVPRHHVLSYHIDDINVLFENN